VLRVRAILATAPSKLVADPLDRAVAYVLESVLGGAKNALKWRGARVSHAKA
jgi:hypothetical protein